MSPFTSDASAAPPAAGKAGGALFHKADALRAMALVLAAAGIGAGLNVLRKPPLPWSYRTRAERLAEQAAVLSGEAAGGGQAPAAALTGEGAAASFPRVTLTELRALAAEGKTVIIDARPPMLFRAGHLPGALNLPREGFQAAYGRHRGNLERDRSRMLVVYCQGGSCADSDLIAGTLRLLGFTRLTVFAGGWREWQAAGLPAEAGN